MDKIEEVRKILFENGIGSERGYIARLICQLFEPETKPDTSRLLTDEELLDTGYPTLEKKTRKERVGLWSLGVMERIAQAQLAKDLEWEAKTASILKAQEQARLERIKKEIEESYCDIGSALDWWQEFWNKVKRGEV